MKDEVRSKFWGEVPGFFVVDLVVEKGWNQQNECGDGSKDGNYDEFMVGRFGGFGLSFLKKCYLLIFVRRSYRDKGHI